MLPQHGNHHVRLRQLQSFLRNVHKQQQSQPDLRYKLKLDRKLYYRPDLHQ
jgi:hypothetical protein